ncbi:hypothetical protein MRX96_045264 [Rhipicephalus microplus]
MSTYFTSVRNPCPLPLTPQKSAAVEAALSSPRQDLQLRLVTRAEDGGARHCLGGKTGSLKAAHIAAF